MAKIARRVSTGPTAWTPPPMRIVGDQLLKLADARNKIAEAEQKAKQAVAEEQAKAESELRAEVEDLKRQLKELLDDLPKLFPKAGGGRRTIIKVLKRDFADLFAIAGLSTADGNFIVGNGTTWTVESGATARTSLGAAADSEVVKLTGNQSVAGTKTFSSAPAVPDASWSIAKTNGLQTALDGKQPLASNLTSLAGTTAGVIENIIEQGAHLAAFTTVAALLADTTLAYGANPNQAATGKTILTLAEGIRYEVAASGASDKHLTTAGGVDLYVLRDSGGRFPVAAWGVSSAVVDNTTKYDAIIAALPTGSALIWPKGQSIAGHFTSPNKVFDNDVNGCSLVNTVDATAIMSMGFGATVNVYSVTETELAHGATQFTVTGASGLFAAGDIGYFHDGATRPGDTDKVNFETIRIDGISTDTITLEGFIRGHQGAGAITFNHMPLQHKDAAIRNGIATPTGTHTGMCFSVWHTDGVEYENLEAVGSHGRAFDIRYCYNVRSNKTFLNRPRSTGSGEGYGLAIWSTTKIVARDIKGLGGRHPLDLDSCYDYLIEDFEEQDSPATSAPCSLAHNGFTSYGIVRNLRCFGAGTNFINFSAQGHGTSAGNALAVNHPIREVHIDGVSHTIAASVNPNDQVLTIYMQADHSGGVRNINTRYLSATAVDATSESAVVRTTGVPIGSWYMENVNANKVGTFYFGNNRASGPTGQVARFRNLTCLDGIRYAIWARGDFGIDVDDVYLGAVAGSELFLMSTQNSDTPTYACIGPNIRYTGSDKNIITTSAATEGHKALHSRSVSTNVSVVAGDSITQAQVQNKDKLLRITPPAGAGTCTLSATTALPAPQINGAELWISVQASRNALEFPAGNNILSTFTIPSPGAARLTSYSGKWWANVISPA